MLTMISKNSEELSNLILEKELQSNNGDSSTYNSEMGKNYSLRTKICDDIEDKTSKTQKMATMAPNDDKKASKVALQKKLKCMGETVKECNDKWHKKHQERAKIGEEVMGKVATTIIATMMVKMATKTQEKEKIKEAPPKTKAKMKERGGSASEMILKYGNKVEQQENFHFYHFKNSTLQICEKEKFENQSDEAKKLRCSNVHGSYSNLPGSVQYYHLLYHSLLYCSYVENFMFKFYKEVLLMMNVFWRIVLIVRDIRERQLFIGET